MIVNFVDPSEFRQGQNFPGGSKVDERMGGMASQRRLSEWFHLSELLPAASGIPTQNGICEAFNGRMRDQLLNDMIFYDLGHAREALARWAGSYNQTRQHSALGYLTPAAFARTFTATDDRLRHPDQPRRSSVAPSAPARQSQPQNSGSNG